MILDGIYREAWEENTAFGMAMRNISEEDLLQTIGRYDNTSDSGNTWDSLRPAVGFSESRWLSACIPASVAQRRVPIIPIIPINLIILINPINPIVLITPIQPDLQSASVFSHGAGRLHWRCLSLLVRHSHGQYGAVGAPMLTTPSWLTIISIPRAGTEASRLT